MRFWTTMAIAAGMLLASSCGVKTGFLRDAVSVSSFEYKMNIDRIEYKRSVSGNANVGLVLCSIPLSGEYYKRAMEELHRAAALQPNEVLTNIREDHAYTTFLGFYCIQDLTLSADVVKLGSAGEAAAAAPPPPAS